MLFAISFCTCNRVGKRTAWILIRLCDAQAGLDPCWSQTHYVGFVVTRLIYFSAQVNNSEVCVNTTPAKSGLFTHVGNSPPAMKIEKENYSQNFTR
jgi:hypothetical protein